MARPRHMIWLGFLLAALARETALAANQYIGAFTGSKPQDDAICGRGKGTFPDPHPCATLAYWNKERRDELRHGDVVRIAPGRYGDTGREAGTGFHCIRLDRFLQGVTIEGRTADDRELRDHEQVILDLGGSGTAGECHGMGLSIGNSRCNENWSPDQDYSGSTFRDFQIANAPYHGAYFCGGKATPAHDLTLERVRITGSAEGGLYVGHGDDGYTDINCGTSGRTVRNVVVRDSEIDHNRGGGSGGIHLACMDTAKIERTFVHDNCARPDCAACQHDIDSSTCDDHDGIGLGGAINATISHCEVTRNGEEGVDIGGHPPGKSHEVLVEDCWVHDNANTNMKVSGGQHVTFRHNFVSGYGLGFEGYACPRFVKLIDNTIWDGGIQLFTYFTNSEFAGNLVRGKEPLVFIDTASTNPTNVWKNNILVHDGTMFAEYGGGTTPDAAGSDCQGNNHASRMFDCSIGYNPPPLPCDARPQEVTKRRADELDAFQSDGRKGLWFGPGSAESDRWSGH